MSRRRRRRSFAQRNPIEELLGMLRQSNISRRNIVRLRELTSNADAVTQSLAEAVLEIARIMPPRRRRFGLVARKHPEILQQIVARLAGKSGDSFEFCDWRVADWFWEEWHQADAERRWLAHRSAPCWCGSSDTYWHCCAARDDDFAEQLAAEERAHEFPGLSASALPWYHPESEMDHVTRSAYELYYADPDHPLAIPPPEERR